jgi:hypothetical protein
MFIKVFLLTALAGLLLVPGQTYCADFSVDDFLPPAAANTVEDENKFSEVKQPDAVKQEAAGTTGAPAIAAASAQDAVNAYVRHRSPGFTELQFPSGFGFAATGAGTYTKHTSTVTARIDQRNAYAKAYINAKRNLAEGLYGLSNEGKTKLVEAMTNIDAPDSGTLTNASSDLTEKIEQSVSGMLRGFIVYAVHDDFDNGTVYVTIVTTPKTQGHGSRPNADTIVTNSVRDGLAQVLMEARKGLVPPVGGKTIFVPQTGELAFVGFGSSVVRVDNDKSLQTKHNLNAEKIAKMRASDSLCGIILGNNIESSDKLDSQTVEMVKDFEILEKDDPVAKQKENSPSYQALTERKKEFMSKEMSSSSISSMRKGVVPPGVKTQTWRDTDNSFAYGLAVYMPSASQRASEAAKKMQQGQIVQPLPSGSGGTGVRPGALPDAGKLEQGPSGQVQSNDAL